MSIEGWIILELRVVPKHTRHNPDDKELKLLLLPYIKGVSERIERGCKKKL